LALPQTYFAKTGFSSKKENPAVPFPFLSLSSSVALFLSGGSGQRSLCEHKQDPGLVELAF